MIMQSLMNLKSFQLKKRSGIYVKSITVDSGRILKRLRPAPQGRAHRIRKRSNHVTIYVDKKESDVEENLN